MKKRIIALIIIMVLTCSLVVNASAAAFSNQASSDSSFRSYEQQRFASIEYIDNYGSNPYNINAGALAKLTIDDIENIYTSMNANAKNKAIGLNSEAITNMSPVS